MTTGPADDDFKARVLHERGPGFHRFEECPICGLLRWCQAELNKPNGAEIVPALSGATDCTRCREIHARAPEIFGWVVGVISKVRRDAIADLATLEKTT